MKPSRRHFLEGLMTGTAAGMIGLPGSANISGAEKISDTAPKAPIGLLNSERLPIRGKFDLCVLGGSCTGVFAAVRAARLGANVVLIERQNAFGGVATSSMVNVWHSLLDTSFEKKIIGGLTDEIIARLKKRGAVTVREKNESIGFIFNSAELIIELDELVLESKIVPHLHALFSEPFYEEGKLTGVIIDGKSGRGIIKADYFIDATGDGDLCVRAGVPSYYHDSIQPPTVCAHWSGYDSKLLHRLLKDHADEFGLKKGFSWGERIPLTPDTMFSGTRVYQINCAEADDLTHAEMEGRRQVRALMDMIRKYGPDAEIGSGRAPGLVALPSCIGIRETRHIRCLHSITDEEALNGKRYPDAIANGSYRFDIHHQDKSGVTFSYLDGSWRYIDGDHQVKTGRWRPETKTNPTFYQFPLRALIPVQTKNVLLAGRMFDAGKHAFSGMRVMVNMNQLGEAAGVAACLALTHNIPVAQVNPADVRQKLKDGGSVII